MDTRTTGPLLDVSAGRVVPVATFFKASALVGTGRFAEVYRAYDTHAETDVALKLYRGSDPESHQAAKNEHSTLIRLATLDSRFFPKLRKAAKHRIGVRNANHPVLVIELGTYQQHAGIKRIVSLKDAMLALDGKGDCHDCAELLREFWTAPSVASWLIKMVQGVALMHSVGVIHRDLKPANILLRQEAGQSDVAPFFLDFNSAAGPDTAEVRSGTPPYLPPEVRSGKRTEPSMQDDVWAAAMIAWEMIHGLNCPVEPSRKPIPGINGTFAPAFLATVHRALSLSPADRFPTSEELLQELQAAHATATPLTIQHTEGLSSQEFAAAKAASSEVGVVLEEALAPPGEVVIPKAVADAVSTLLSWLNEEQTQSLDLVGELVRLGPRAIPVCLQQGYKVPFDSRVGDEIIEALRQLAKQDPQIAEYAVNTYALSSNVAVRSICRRLCEEVETLPALFVESLTNDDGTLLPEERLEIADLCLRYGSDSGAMLALSKYLCREYILGPGRYPVLSRRIASRMGAMPFDDRALLIVEDTVDHIWEELPEFDKVPAGKRDDIERGLLELMADAFSSMDDEALSLFKADEVPRQTSGNPSLPIYRRFAIKLAGKSPAAREWFLRRADDDRRDGILRSIAEKLRTTPGVVELDDLRRTFDAYIADGQSDDLNALRFSTDPRLFRLLDDAMTHRPDWNQLDRVLNLLKKFQSRQRQLVVPFLLRHWSPLTARDYSLVADVLTTHGVPERFRDAAVGQLSKDLKGPNEPVAREALERILS